MGSIREEIRQGRPFEHAEEEALVTIARTADVLHCAMERLFKPWGISSEQYNILRILRGAPHPTLEVKFRMISHGAHITRLIDKLAEKKLVRRERAADRRVVLVHITTEGLRLLKEVGPQLNKAQKQIMGKVDPANIEAMIETLDAIRKAAAG